MKKCNTLVRMGLALAALVWLTDPCGAQFPPRFPLLKNKEVQKDLKLSEEQAAKINDLYAEHSKIDPKNKESFAKVEKLTEEILGTLTPDQTKRHKQLQIQHHGANALGYDEVVEPLKLTDEQQTKIRETLNEMSAKIKKIVADAGGFKEAQPKIAELQKKTLADLVKTLTDKQQTQWRTLIGEPFQGTFPPNYLTYFGSGGIGFPKKDKDKE